MVFTSLSRNLILNSCPRTSLKLVFWTILPFSLAHVWFRPFPWKALHAAQARRFFSLCDDPCSISQKPRIGWQRQKYPESGRRGKTEEAKAGFSSVGGKEGRLWTFLYINSFVVGYSQNFYLMYDGLHSLLSCPLKCCSFTTWIPKCIATWLDKHICPQYSWGQL